MSLRKTCDLPEIEATAELSNCIVEVSYKSSPAAAYDSYYYDLKKLADKIQLPVTNASADIENKLTTKITTPSAVHDYVDAKLHPTSQLSSDIAARNTTKIVSPLAIHDYISAQGFISIVDESWKDLINQLSLMFNKTDLCIYVSMEYGNNANSGTDKAHPFKTLSKAVEKANERRFFSSAQCYIFLSGDYNMIANSDGTSFDGGATFYHPDLNGSKQFYLQSYPDGSTYTIYADYTNIYRNYTTGLRAECHISFNNINIKSKFRTVTAAELENKSDFWYSYTPTNNIDAMCCYHDRCRFIYYATKAGSGIGSNSNGIVDLNNVTIEGFRWGLVAGGTLNNVTFNNCTQCVAPGAGGVIAFGENKVVKIQGATETAFALQNPNSTFFWTYKTKLEVLSCYQLIDTNANGTFQFRFWNSDANAYADDPDNKFGLSINNIVPYLPASLSSYGNSSLSPKNHHDCDTANDIHAYALDLLGSDINQVYLSTHTITTKYAEDNALSNNYYIKIGPATFTYESLTDGSKTYYQKLFGFPTT